MDRKPGRKEYAVSTLLAVAVLYALFLVKMFVIPVEDPFGPALVMHMKLLLPSIAIGIVTCAVFLSVRKPSLLLTVAVTAVFSSLMCDGSRYTAVYAFAALCFLGSIPFIASLLADLRHIGSEDEA